MLNNIKYDLSIRSFLQSGLFLKKAPLIFIVFFFLTCLFAGIFFSICISTTDRTSLISPICDLMTCNTPALHSLIKNDLILLLVIFLAGLSLYGFPAALLALSLKGISIGFCAGILYSSSSWDILLSLIISDSLIIPAYVLSVFASINYSFTNIFLKSDPRLYTRDYVFLYLAASGLAIFSAAVETLLLRLH